jgi:hypothetical protein
MNLDFERRIALYQTAFPDWPAPTIGSDGRLQGIWILGNNYRNKTDYYGTFPPNFLRRIGTLFPEIYSCNSLFIFSGALTNEDVGDALRCDINNEFSPDINCDVLLLKASQFVPLLEIIVADPPYSVEDAEHYGTPLVNRNAVMGKCYDLLQPGGLVLWLDQVLPMYSKQHFRIVGIIGIVRSTNHRFRCLVIFQKNEDDKENEIK